MPNQLLVGTPKGLVVVKRENGNWKIGEVHFLGLPVSFIYVDERSLMWWAAISLRHWGEKLYFSVDRGKHWNEAEIPNFRNHFYRPDKLAVLKKLWVMQQAGNDKPNCLWLGTEPGGLFFSDNQGRSWQLNESLWNHPSRLDDQQWFGAGKDFPFIHSIVIDPRDSNHFYVAVSCAGVFETRDGGKNWNTKNKGLVAAYLPKSDVEVGHDPHRMLLCPANPNVIWQQNHCGIFRTVNGGEFWEDVSGKNGFPKYGFALAIDESDSNLAWVIPAQSDEMRVPVDLKLTVSRTSDAGKNWISFSEGLPQSNSFDLVLRHAFAKNGNTLAFGSNNGNIYLSDNRGESWNVIAQNLSAVNGLVFS